ncbi:C40 family peptidase [Urechidicola croceus]|uniref:Hydrolase Nlp/P60 n=1 Tax=Urechidicola croceus TaxID=1850246 RepID=A0A1D8P675_9FLAO|nr:C40 family peptidase [Urechidicola croceus]AOW20074.1 hydrolase Nlp/P60 [Urechidicola croceus]
MQYGICNLSIVSLRFEPSDTSEMVSQVLFGEHFKVLEKRAKWSKIRIAFDNYEGWIDNKQYIEITEDKYQIIDKNPICLAGELVDFIDDKNQNLTPIPLGSSLPFFKDNELKVSESIYSYEGTVLSGILNKELLIKTAFMYLNSPYLWGGKTPFGIDCSGFTQMVYKLCGYRLLRDASQQATQGEVLSFIEESEPGDLAFFDNNEGTIVHVGIIMKDNYIIHAHGKVRIDRLDHSGIYNIDTHRHTHKLRVIKKII